MKVLLKNAPKPQLVLTPERCIIDKFKSRIKRDIQMFECINYFQIEKTTGTLLGSESTYLAVLEIYNENKKKYGKVKLNITYISSNNELLDRKKVARLSAPTNLTVDEHIQLGLQGPNKDSYVRLNELRAVQMKRLRCSSALLTCYLGFGISHLGAIRSLNLKAFKMSNQDRDTGIDIIQFILDAIAAFKKSATQTNDNFIIENSKYLESELSFLHAMCSFYRNHTQNERMAFLKYIDNYAFGNDNVGPTIRFCYLRFKRWREALEDLEESMRRAITIYHP